MMKFDNMTVDKFADVLIDVRDGLKEAKKTTPEPAMIAYLLVDLLKVTEALAVFSDDKLIEGIYKDNYLERLIETCYLFIENKDLSVYEFHQYINNTKDLVSLMPYLKTFLETQK